MTGLKSGPSLFYFPTGRYIDYLSLANAINKYKKYIYIYNTINTISNTGYVGYAESKYRLRISLVHPRDCYFAHVQRLPLSVEKQQTPFREIRVMFMFVPVR